MTQQSVVTGERAARQMEELQAARAELEHLRHMVSAFETAYLRLSCLQEILLPCELPEIPGIEAAAWYRSAAEETVVGGDFYDLFELAADAWGILIGDVGGKGTTAASMTALVRYTVQAAALLQNPPSRILATVNDALLNRRSDAAICTAACGLVRPIGGGPDAAGGVRITLSSGGHPCPLLLRKEGTVTTIGQPDLLLGVLGRPVGRDHEVELRPEDTLVFYTDGITEAGPVGAFFGEERLAALLDGCAGLDAAGIVARIHRVVTAFESGTPRDDVAVVALRVYPEGEGGV